jgi:hypothetical protein
MQVFWNFLGLATVWATLKKWPINFKSSGHPETHQKMLAIILSAVMLSVVAPCINDKCLVRPYHFGTHLYILIFKVKLFKEN